MICLGCFFVCKKFDILCDLLLICVGIQFEVLVGGQVVEFYSDGVCDIIKGYGGWVIILCYGECELVFSGNEENIINNCMELCGLFEGLCMLWCFCQVKVIIDSQYFCKVFIDGWIFNWQCNGWKMVSKELVKNQDFWEEFIEFVKVYVLIFLWVKGYVGYGENEWVDEFVVLECKKLWK